MGHDLTVREVEADMHVNNTLSLWLLQMIPVTSLQFFSDSGKELILSFSVCQWTKRGIYESMNCLSVMRLKGDKERCGTDTPNTQALDKATLSIHMAETIYWPYK